MQLRLLSSTVEHRSQSWSIVHFSRVPHLSGCPRPAIVAAICLTAPTPAAARAALSPGGEWSSPYPAAGDCSVGSGVGKGCRLRFHYRFVRCHSSGDRGGAVVSERPVSRSGSITQADLERLAELLQDLEERRAARNGREAVQVDAVAEAGALRVLLEEADLSLPELEALVVRHRGPPLSACFQRVSGWSGTAALPGLRAQCGMSRRQVAQALMRFPGLLTTYMDDAGTVARRLRWHLCTDWASKRELGGEASLAATLTREPRLLTLDRDALKVKVHELLRLVVNPQLPVPEDVIAGVGPVSWQRHYCGLLQPALRDHPAALVGRGVKNMRQRIGWLASHLELRQRATPEAARLLVIAAGLDVKLIESRVKALQRTTGLESRAALRAFLLSCPESLLADAKAVDAAAGVLAERCPDQPSAQAVLQRLLRMHGAQCAEFAGVIDVLEPRVGPEMM